jgi:hypothetical protein
MLVDIFSNFHTICSVTILTLFIYPKTTGPFESELFPFAVLASFPITLFELYVKKKNSGERVLKVGN